ncbi:MAG: holo-[acyl-carrier-protein] synthase [Deltaproteobacteria bacterium RBG_19FT_COMBO_43_11]|nr:MAG: holo-[acyl-carrier-protein] synthase [Deltaproteobacteria bacterium RBG_19FT_COMBO_43_11]
MIYGIGIDLVENERIKKIIEKWGDKFLQRVFSEKEVEYCRRHVQAPIHYAARFAVKESFLKALGIGLGMGVKLREIEVARNSKGKPDLVLSGGAKAQIEKHKITKVHVSLTHTKKYATAFVILEKN